MPDDRLPGNVRFDWLLLVASLACLVFLGVQVFPIMWGIALGFTNSGPFVSTPEFVGFANFEIILTDPKFWAALWRGCVAAVAIVTIQVVVGVGISVLLFRHAGTMVRSVILLPYLIPAVTGALAWRWITDSLYGILNHELMTLGIINAPIDFATSPYWAMPLIVLASVWQFTPFVVLIMIATLSTIPKETYEAARIDGATSWKEFLYITLPILRSTILLVILLRTVWMFNRFDIIWLLTGGGPRGATTTLPLYAYFQAFADNDYGTAGAVSSMMFLILLVFGTIYLSVFQPEKQVIRG